MASHLYYHFYWAWVPKRLVIKCIRDGGAILRRREWLPRMFALSGCAAMAGRLDAQPMGARTGLIIDARCHAGKGVELYKIRLLKLSPEKERKVLADNILRFLSNES